MRSDIELQTKDGKPCVTFDSSGSENPNKMLDCLSTHNWEVTSYQNSQMLGLVVALRCSRCHLEWSSIISKSNTP